MKSSTQSVAVRHPNSVTMEATVEAARALLEALPSLSLPTVAELAAREETVKVTITLSRNAVEFFKHEARARRTQYQKMIRRLLDEYVQIQRTLDDDASDGDA